MKRQSAPSSDYFVERERERDRKEGGRKGVSVGWDEMGVAVAAAVREVR